MSLLTLERATECSGSEFSPEFSCEISSVGSVGSGSTAALFARLLSLGLFFGGIAHEAGDESRADRIAAARVKPTLSARPPRRQQRAAAPLRTPHGFSRAGPAASCASDDFLSRELTTVSKSRRTHRCAGSRPKWLWHPNETIPGGVDISERVGTRVS